MKVLIVEDHSDMRDLLGRIVEAMGYVPVLASGGKEGLEESYRGEAKLNPTGHEDALDGWSGSGTKASSEP